MQRIFVTLFILFIGLGLSLDDAQARRFGGGKSSGMQRNSGSQQQAPSPSQQNAGKPAQNPSGAAAPNTPGKRSWLGPLAGLAAGLGLAALASHLGLGAEFANILLIALLVMGGVLVFRMLTRKRPQPGQAMQYAGMGAGGGMAPVSGLPPNSLSTTPTPISTAPAPPTTLPKDFDVPAFVREAKLNFIRLQAANDAGDLNDIREFTSPEMYAEIKLQLDERGKAPQRTEVTLLDAEVLECAEEPGRYVVSVRFHGLIREDADAPATDFDEVWNLTKPSDGSHGWVVAGIQQTH